MTTQPFKIIALSVVAAVGYGVVHDQITARVCVECFTFRHPPIFDTDSPTLLALGWGVIATWWAGLIVGVPVAVAARAGRRPAVSAGALVRPLAVLLAVLLAAMAVVAAAAGVVGYVVAVRGVVYLVGPIADHVPADRHAAFIADLWTHLASYAGGFIGGLVLCVVVWRRRAARTGSTSTA